MDAETQRINALLVMAENEQRQLASSDVGGIQRRANQDKLNELGNLRYEANQRYIKAKAQYDKEQFQSRKDQTTTMQKKGIDVKAAALLAAGYLIFRG